MAGKRRRHSGKQTSTRQGDVDMDPRDTPDVGTVTDGFLPQPYGAPLPNKILEDQPSEGGAPPPNKRRRGEKSFEEAVDYNIAKRSIVGLARIRSSQNFVIDDSAPFPDRKDTYQLAPLEFVKLDTWDGVRRHSAVTGPAATGYDRQGSIGDEILDVSDRSSFVLAGGLPVFTDDGIQTILGDAPFNASGVERSALFRVRNAMLSRIVVRIRNLTGSADIGRAGNVKVYVTKERPAEGDAITAVAIIQARKITAVFQDFSVWLFAPLQEVEDTLPAPSAEDTYRVTIVPDDGVTVDIDAVDTLSGIVPKFKVFTFFAGGDVNNPEAFRSAAAIKYFGARTANPGAAGVPGSLFALPAGGTASAVLLPSASTSTLDGTDQTDQVGDGTTTVDFYEVLAKPFTLIRGAYKVHLEFANAAASNLEEVTVEIIRNTAAGIQVIATKTFTGLALVGAALEFNIYLELGSNADFLTGMLMGLRVIFENAAGAGTLSLIHTRGGDDLHMEAVISA